MTVPVSVAAVVLARRVLPEGAHGARRRFDWHGAAAITGAVIALVHGALGVADRGWTSPSVLASLAASAALLAAFIAVERRTADPLVPLELFRSRTLSTGVGLAVLGGAARASTFVLVALYLQQALAHGPPAGRPGDGPHLADRLRRLPRPPAADPARPRPAAHPRRRPRRPRRRPPVARPRTAAGTGTPSPSCPGCCWSPSASPSASRPPPWSSPPRSPDTHAGLASGLAGSATQVGAALGTAAFTAIGISVSGHRHRPLGASGFTAAFTAAAVVALATAALGSTIARRQH